MLDIWALAHSRYERDPLSEQQWMTWGRYFTHMVSTEAEAISQSRWEQLQYGFEAELWENGQRFVFDWPCLPWIRDAR